MRFCTFAVGCVLLLTSAMIPSGCQYLHVEGPAWVKAETKEPHPSGVTSSAMFLFFLCAIGGGLAIAAGCGLFDEPKK